MKAAGLKAIDTVVESTATLIKSKRPSNQKLVDLIAQRINGVISKSFHPSQAQNMTSKLTLPTQLRKNTYSASITSLALFSRPPLRSRPESERLLLQRSKIRSGSLLARWFLKNQSRLSWIS